RDALLAAEIRAVDVDHHVHHPPRRTFSRRIDDEIRPIGAGARMTIGAVDSEIRGDDAHARDEIIDGKILERRGRDVLERLARLLCGRRSGGLTLRRGPRLQSQTGHPQTGQAGYRERERSVTPHGPFPNDSDRRAGRDVLAPGAHRNLIWRSIFTRYRLRRDRGGPVDACGTPSCRWTSLRFARRAARVGAVRASPERLVERRLGADPREADARRPGIQMGWQGDHGEDQPWTQ